MDINFNLKDLTLTQALPILNNLKNYVKELGSRVQTNNSYDSQNPPAYNSKETLELYDAATKKLIELKVAIQTANVPIIGKILERSELKARKSLLEGMSTRAGKSKDTIGYSDTAIDVEFVATLDQRWVDEERSRLQERITALQHELDVFNFTTKLG